MKKNLARIVAIILFAGAFTACENEVKAPPTEVVSDTVESTKTYSGEWESLAAEDLGNGTFATRYFNLRQEDWEVKFTLYLDETLNTPVFEFRGLGKYELQGASEKVEGAQNALFRFDKKYVTLLTDNSDLIQNFGFSVCSLEKGTEQDITKDGCSFLVSKAVCGQEYDLLKLDKNLLYFGARPAEGDMCVAERRPAALSFPLKRVTIKK